jgi:hypothetical protein
VGPVHVGPLLFLLLLYPLALLLLLLLQAPGGTRADLTRAVRLLPWLLAHRLLPAPPEEAAEDLGDDALQAPQPGTAGGHCGSGVAITPLVTLTDALRATAAGSASKRGRGGDAAAVDDPWTRDLVARGLELQVRVSTICAGSGVVLYASGAAGAF